MPSLEKLHGRESAVDRAKRWWQRIQLMPPSERSDLHAHLDYYIAFFEAAYAITDFAKKTGVQGLPDTPTKKVLRDIVNRTKHFTISQPSFDAEYFICREFKGGQTPDWELVVCGSGEKMPLWELAEQVMSDIESITPN